MKIDLVFLLKAIKDCENVYIYYKQNQETLRYFSRFFRVQPEEDAIVIDYPFVDGYTHKQLAANDPISIYFHLAGFRFHFNSIVKEATHFSLEDGTPIPALKITWPEEILDGNRRSLYRVTLHLDKSIRVNYYILGNVKEDGAFAGAEQVEYQGIEAIMIDISENGIAVEINRKINIAVGDRLRFRFRLHENDREQIEIEGLVRNIREFPGSDIHICGIQFSPGNTTGHKRSLQKIACSIMARNRENISFFTVNQTVSQNPFVQKIVENEITGEFLHMLLLKKLPLSDEEYLESLVYVLRLEKFKDRALEVLLTLPVEVKEAYIQRTDANHRVAYYLLGEAISHSHLKVIAGAVSNHYLPVEFLSRIAEKGTAHMLRVLAADKIKLIAYPEIMDIMEKNTHITAAVKEKIRGIRDSYLLKQEAQLIPEHAVIEGFSDFVAAMGKDGTGPVQPVKAEEVKKKTLTTLQRINKMSIQQRIRLALTGNKSERMILANDRNQYVVQAVIESPTLSEDEVLIITQKKNISKEVAEKICSNKIWMCNHSIMFAMLKNPKVLMKKVPDFLKKVHRRELKELSIDKNINPEVRKLADYRFNRRK